MLKRAVVLGGVMAVGVAAVPFVRHAMSRFKPAVTNALTAGTSAEAPPSRRVAVVLSGSGVYDGSEIQEAVSALIHLSKANADVRVFAPNMDQYHVINHLTGDVMTEESRNVLVEAARIARGKVEKLDLLDVNQFDAVVVPGGFGVAKNLSSFAFDGENMQVQPQVATTLTAFHAAKKPIGLICIAPVLGGKLFPGAELTMGRRSGAKWSSGPDAASAVESWGGKIVEKDFDQVHVDTTNKIVSAPAYMYDHATPSTAFDNVGQVIDAVVRMK
ncbi:hypothetical protein H310_00120 [Aphanomyces invadans]|uniref:DJ-1/PfpI domain-containing protein n=1 Tax=Aphanomyces invadans TaxID=157072 RepID=A0A024USS2_9STRA|nr:hypothetical protein H310_00120 [Aphanomyces invadans]ETW09571.1 hypothetical protein H310_00120 [Aphanomyces invadans]RHY35105.1 hypothetical protein DYB32_000425 [Aphanomyces invadans]|eukprot:XP_008860982.1 hypothetical protein H310_00120 [Aphanomyces invadans]